MSWTPIDFGILADLKTKGHISKRPVLTEIGSQDMSRSLLDDQFPINALCRSFGADERTFSISDARELWTWLGFSHFCLGQNNDPRTIAVDLNFDEAPAHLRKISDLVANVGTTSHTANQLNAFKVIHDLCSVGGLMYHHVPAEGFMTHGLVKYDPKFFWMLARSNAYKWIHWDFRSSRVSTTLHRDVLQELRAFHANDVARLENYSISDGSLIVVLQKIYDIDFVPPLDTPNGLIPDAATSERYWTVFQPERLQEFINKSN